MALLSSWKYSAQGCKYCNFQQPSQYHSHQTLRRSQQPSAAEPHLLWITLVLCPPFITLDRECKTDGCRCWMAPKWSTSLRVHTLVTSDPDPLDPPLAELRFKLSDCRTSELGDAAGRRGTKSFTLWPLFPACALTSFFVLKKRPPQSLARRAAWRWRDTCIYGCRREKTQ